MTLDASPPRETLALLVKFVLVGALNTGFSYAIYAIGLWLGVHYVLANFAAAVLGTLFSFVTQGGLVFKRLEGKRLPRFLALWGALWLLNVALITLLLPALNHNAYVAGAIALVIVTVVSFLAQRYLVFGDGSFRS